MITKNLLFILITLLTLVSCSNVIYLKETVKVDKSAMKTYLKDLKEVALNKHYTVLMSYMDADYLKEQHEENLNGNDLQFVNEIFCGKDIIDDSFHCITQESITYFEAKEITQIEDTKYKALFIVGNTENKVACKLLISKKIKDGKIKLGILGAVG